jgi:hypothetical protein
MEAFLENFASRPMSMSGWISPACLPARALDFDSRPELAHAAGCLVAAAGGAGFLDGLFDRFAGFAGALLNPANQFVLFAFGVLEIAIRELGPFLFQLALGDVPVTFDFQCGHNISSVICYFSFQFAADMTAKMFPRLGLAPPANPRSA